MEIVALFLVSGCLAFLLTKVITTHREDMQYARRGEVPPRIEAKLAAFEAGTAPVRPARPGAKGYWRELWHDSWDDLTERHRRIRAAKKAGEHPHVVERLRNWWRWAVTPLGAKTATAEPAGDPAPQVEPVAATDLPPGTWTVDDDGEQVPLAPTDPQPEPAAEPDPTPEPTDNSAPTGTAEEAPTMDPVAEEVTSNEELRRNFDRMRDAAARGRDALAVVEAARQEIAAAARASADGTAAKKFDEAATTAAHEVDEQVNLGTLSQWSEVFDNAHAAAATGKASLDKYRDAEDVVASNNVDASTLATNAA